MNDIKVIIVEDEPDIQVFLSNLLKQEGFVPVVSENGEEGLNRARTEHPGVIVIDMMIPKGDGVNMYRELKRDGTLKELPVIMLSTIDQKTFFQFQNIQPAQSPQGLPPPQAYLEKPPEVEDFLKWVRLLTGNKCGLNEI